MTVAYDPHEEWDRETPAPEHSDRARHVTEQVSLWIANDGDYYESAQCWALRDQAADHEGYPQLATYVSSTLRVTRPGSAAWHVARELSPNDLDRIRWADVAAQLLPEVE